MKKVKKLKRSHVIGLAAAISVLLIATAIFSYTRHAASGRKAGIVDKREFALIEGTLEADEVDVSSKIPGRISSIRVEEGDPVRPGELLATLESREVDAKAAQAFGAYRAAQAQHSQAQVGVTLQRYTVQDQVEQARAAYKAAQSKLQMALNGARPQEIRQAEKALEQAVAAYETARDTYDRFHGLYVEGVIPKQREEEIELQYRSAKAQKDAADAKLNLIKEGPRKEEIQQAREGVKAAEAGLRLAEDSALQVDIRKQDVAATAYKSDAAKGQLDEAKSYQREARICSPISGYISQKMSHSGEMVSAGFPIFTIVKARDYKVKVYADETNFGGLKLYDIVTIMIPALNNKCVDGRIIRISQAADFAVKKATNEQNSFDIRSLQLVVKVLGDHPDLRNSMTARVRLPYESKSRP